MSRKLMILVGLVWCWSVGCVPLTNRQQYLPTWSVQGNQLEARGRQADLGQLSCALGNLNVTRIWFGFRSADLIPGCAEDIDSGDQCLVQIPRDQMHCKDNGVCSYPEINMEILPTSGCYGSAELYWQVCYHCPEDDRLLQEFEDDDVYTFYSNTDDMYSPYINNDMYTYYANADDMYSSYTHDDSYVYYSDDGLQQFNDEEYQANDANVSQSTFFESRYDMEGYENLQCKEFEQIHLQSALFGYEDLSSTSSSLTCAEQLAERVRSMLCHQTYCTNPTRNLLQLSNSNLCNASKQERLFGVWKIEYECLKNQYANTNNVERSQMTDQDEQEDENPSNIIKEVKTLETLTNLPDVLLKETAMLGKSNDESHVLNTHKGIKVNKEHFMEEKNESSILSESPKIDNATFLPLENKKDMKIPLMKTKEFKVDDVNNGFQKLEKEIEIKTAKMQTSETDIEGINNSFLDVEKQIEFETPTLQISEAESKNKGNGNTLESYSGINFMEKQKQQSLDDIEDDHIPSVKNQTTSGKFFQKLEGFQQLEDEIEIETTIMQTTETDFVKINHSFVEADKEKEAETTITQISEAEVNNEGNNSNELTFHSNNAFVGKQKQQSFDDIENDHVPSMKTLSVSSAYFHTMEGTIEKSDNKSVAEDEYGLPYVEKDYQIHHNHRYQGTHFLNLSDDETFDVHETFNVQERNVQKTHDDMDEKTKTAKQELFQQNNDTSKLNLHGLEYYDSSDSKNLTKNNKSNQFSDSDYIKAERMPLDINIIKDLVPTSIRHDHDEDSLLNSRSNHGKDIEEEKLNTDQVKMNQEFQTEENHNDVNTESLHNSLSNSYKSNFSRFDVQMKSTNFINESVITSSALGTLSSEKIIENYHTVMKLNTSDLDTKILEIDSYMSDDDIPQKDYLQSKLHYTNTTLDKYDMSHAHANDTLLSQHSQFVSVQENSFKEQVISIVNSGATHDTNDGKGNPEDKPSKSTEYPAEKNLNAPPQNEILSYLSFQTEGSKSYTPEQGSTKYSKASSKLFPLKPFSVDEEQIDTVDEETNNFKLHSTIQSSKQNSTKEVINVPLSSDTIAETSSQLSASVLMNKLKKNPHNEKVDFQGMSHGSLTYNETEVELNKKKSPKLFHFKSDESDGEFKEKKIELNSTNSATLDTAGNLNEIDRYHDQELYSSKKNSKQLSNIGKVFIAKEASNIKTNPNLKTWSKKPVQSSIPTDDISKVTENSSLRSEYNVLSSLNDVDITESDQNWKEVKNENEQTDATNQTSNFSKHGPLTENVLETYIETENTAEKSSKENQKNRFENSTTGDKYEYISSQAVQATNSDLTNVVDSVLVSRRPDSKHVQTKGNVTFKKEYDLIDYDAENIVIKNDSSNQLRTKHMYNNNNNFSNNGTFLADNTDNNKIEDDFEENLKSKEYELRESKFINLTPKNSNLSNQESNKNSDDRTKSRLNINLTKSSIPFSEDKSDNELNKGIAYFNISTIMDSTLEESNETTNTNLNTDFQYVKNNELENYEIGLKDITNSRDKHKEDRDEENIVKIMDNINLNISSLKPTYSRTDFDNNPEKFKVQSHELSNLGNLYVKEKDLELESNTTISRKKLLDNFTSYDSLNSKLNEPMNTSSVDSKIKTTQPLELRILKDTEKEIKGEISKFKSELEMIINVNDNIQNISQSVIKEATQKSVTNFFRSISSSLNVFNFHKDEIKKESVHRSEQDSVDTASNILKVSETISDTIASTLEVGSSLNIRTADIAMTVFKKSTEEPKDSSTHWESGSVKVVLPDQVSLVGKDSSITLSFATFDKIGSMMSLNENVSSTVLSINVLNLPITNESVPLTKPIEFLLHHSEIDDSVRRNCVYWDFNLSIWSNTGCSPVISASQRNFTTCRCDHLTNFAILVDMHNLAMEPDFKIGLDVFTLIGCTTSIISLSLCILVFATFRSARNERSTINFNICLCLLISELIFICGIGQTENYTICYAVSVALHYMFLASFFWMLIAGFQIYVLLVEVFEQDSSRLVQYYVLGYISPLLILLSSMLFDTLYNESSVYGGEEYCWISQRMHLLISFIVPIAGVMLLNVYFLGIASWRIHKHFTTSPQVYKSRTTSLKSYINGLLGLMSMLGVTWTVGLISIIYPTQTLTYAFTVLNSLQGFFIFIFNCVLNKKIRGEGTKLLTSAMSCMRLKLSTAPLVRKESTNSTTSNTNTTQVREYFLPEMQYNVGAKIQNRPKQVDLSITYYY